MSVNLPQDSHPHSAEMPENHEINVTPFIDVMLVLLIVFMVAAPLATVDIKVDLPPTHSTAQPRTEKPIFISLDSNGNLVVDEEQVAMNALVPLVTLKVDGDSGRRLFLRVDRQVPYGEVLPILSALREAGFLKVALVGLESGAR